jgi:hypothetical protein
MIAPTLLTADRSLRVQWFRYSIESNINPAWRTARYLVVSPVAVWPSQRRTVLK